MNETSRTIKPRIAGTPSMPTPPRDRRESRPAKNTIIHEAPNNSDPYAIAGMPSRARTKRLPRLRLVPLQSKLVLSHTAVYATNKHHPKNPMYRIGLTSAWRFISGAVALGPELGDDRY
jgi:hypothetical protein